MIDKKEQLLEIVYTQLDTDKFIDGFFKQKHGDQYKGLDDDMSDDFEDWLVEMEFEELDQLFSVAVKMRCSI